jgi:hypothetical protein
LEGAKNGQQRQKERQETQAGKGQEGCKKQKEVGWFKRGFASLWGIFSFPF